ncbi:MAG TPA: hypothetical protein VHO03_20195 [Ignavibacteriales bacterium]|nr:hypothetical protein [Ignavibacteriales bacterium]
MKTFRKGAYNILILLVYLFTLQAATGSALLTIYASASDGIVSIKQHKPKPCHRHQILLRKHLNITTNERTAGSQAFTCAPFSLPEVKDFVGLIISSYIISLSNPESGKIKDRAPPQLS